MENKIEKAYNEYMEINARFMLAVEQGNEVGKERERAEIRKWESKYSIEGVAFEEAFEQYKHSRENGNDGLNIEDNIHDKSEFLKYLKANGITSFTVSCPFDGLRHACEFLEAGCKVKGTTMVNGDEEPFTNEHEKLHALILEIE